MHESLFWLILVNELALVLDGKAGLGVDTIHGEWEQGRVRMLCRDLVQCLSSRAFCAGDSKASEQENNTLGVTEVNESSEVILTPAETRCKGKQYGERKFGCCLELLQQIDQSACVE
jgi:hypothetical protein